MISHDEKKIYSRQLDIDSWGIETQERLKNSTVFIAGAGGLGSPVSYYLTAAGVGNLIISDYDIIDISNLNRQILHSYQKIGLKKVDSAYKTLTGLNPHVNIRCIDTKITAENISVFAGDSDLIIDCLDNFQTRFVLNEFSVTSSIPMIHGGVSGMIGQIMFIKPPKTACLSCIITKVKKEEKVAIAGCTAGVIGSLQATEAIKYLTGIGETLFNKILFYDGIAMRFDTISISKNLQCPVCGKK